MESNTHPFQWSAASTKSLNPQPWSGTPRMIWTFRSDFQPQLLAPKDQSVMSQSTSWNARKVALLARTTQSLVWHANQVTCLTTKPKSAFRPITATQVVILAPKMVYQLNAQLARQTFPPWVMKIHPQLKTQVPAPWLPPTMLKSSWLSIKTLYWV